MSRPKRVTDHGFDETSVRHQLDAADWEPSDERGYEEQRLWLGTVFGITPSGKVYVPFACGNVAGDCPVCEGDGLRIPRTGRRARKRAARRLMMFARNTLRSGDGWRGAYATKVAKQRATANNAANTVCMACDGLGSLSAAKDERFWEALNRFAESINASVGSEDGENYFLVRTRGAEETEDDHGGTDEIHAHD